MLNFVYAHGRIVPHHSAHVSISDLVLHRGYGIFDYFTYINGQNAYLEHYLNRFYLCAKHVGLIIPKNRKSLQATIDKLYDANAESNIHIKLILTAGTSANGYDPDKEAELYILAYRSQYPAPRYYQMGARLITRQHQRELPEIKSINYLSSVIDRRKMKDYDASDVLYIDGNMVRETSRANIFIVKDGCIKTPAQQILQGITRLKLIQHTPFDIVISDFTIDELLAADEVFITSTTKKALPVVGIDGQDIGNGQVGMVSKKILEYLES